MGLVLESALGLGLGLALALTPTLTLSPRLQSPRRGAPHIAQCPWRAAEGELRVRVREVHGGVERVDRALGRVHLVSGDMREMWGGDGEMCGGGIGEIRGDIGRTTTPGLREMGEI